MRVIIMLNSLAIGGVQRLALDDAAELCRRGHNVILVTTEKALGESYAEEAGLQKYVWRQIYFSSIWDWLGWKNLFLLVREFKPEIFITHMWFANNVGRVIAWLCGVPKILAFEHSVYDDIKPRKQFFIDWALQFITTRIIAVSHAVKKSLIEHGIAEKKIKIINNGIVLSRFCPSAERAVLRSDLGLKENDFVFITIGRLQAVKNISEIIMALAAVSDVKLLVVGNGGERIALEELARKNKIVERVIFTGMRTDIPDLLFAADALVSASRGREGFGLVLLEAMACQIPVITARYAAAEEIVTDGFNGMIYENPDELVKLIERFKQDSALRAELVAGGAKVIAGFTIERQVDELLKI